MILHFAVNVPRVECGNAIKANVRYSIYVFWKAACTNITMMTTLKL
jgi:hypothetical protein